MIKCFFVDVKSIKSDLPKSNFVESELEQLADLILATDGLLRPLILKESGTGKYKVIEGHREYYAAVRAKEKNISKAEMVNAFVIDASNQKSAIAQLALLSGQPTPQPIKATEESSLLDKILPLIEAKISQQLQPLIDRLNNHEEILDRLTSPEPILPLIESTVSDRFKPISAQLSKHKELLETLESDVKKLKEVIPPKPPSSKQTESSVASLPTPSEEEPPTQSDTVKPDPKKRTTSTTNTKKTVKADLQSTISDEEQIEQPKPKEVAAVKTTKTNTKSKPLSNFSASIDPTKATTVLNLINTLDRQQLTVSMERSGLKTSVKFVPNIIEYRDKLPDRQIDRWETILAAKISGLTEVVIKKIIDKLK